MRKFSSIAAGLALVAAMLACNLPSGQQTPAAVLTSAALTVQAQLTANPPGEATATFTAGRFDGGIHRYAGADHTAGGLTDAGLRPGAVRQGCQHPRRDKIRSESELHQDLEA